METERSQHVLSVTLYEETSPGLTGSKPTDQKNPLIPSNYFSSILKSTKSKKKTHPLYIVPVRNKRESSVI